MRVSTTQDFQGLPSGSVLQNVIESPEGHYTGLWCSAAGTFTVSVPREMCRVWPEDETFFDHFYTNRSKQ